MINEDVTPSTPQWTESVAVGSKSFTETIKEKLGILAKGRKIFENDGGFQPREERELPAGCAAKHLQFGGSSYFPASSRIFTHILRWPKLKPTPKHRMSQFA